MFSINKIYNLVYYLKLKLYSICVWFSSYLKCWTLFLWFRSRYFKSAEWPTGGGSSHFFNKKRDSCSNQSRAWWQWPEVEETLVQTEHWQRRGQWGSVNWWLDHRWSVWLEYWWTPPLTAMKGVTVKDAAQNGRPGLYRAQAEKKIHI